MSQKMKLRFKLAVLVGVVFQFGGIIGACTDILEIISTPVIFLGALDQLGIGLFPNLDEL